MCLLSLNYSAYFGMLFHRDQSSFKYHPFFVSFTRYNHQHVLTWFRENPVSLLCIEWDSDMWNAARGYVIDCVNILTTEKLTSSLEIKCVDNSSIRTRNVYFAAVKELRCSYILGLVWRLISHIVSILASTSIVICFNEHSARLVVFCLIKAQVLIGFVKYPHVFISYVWCVSNIFKYRYIKKIGNFCMLLFVEYKITI